MPQLGYYTPRPNYVTIIHQTSGQVSHTALAVDSENFPCLSEEE